jgi:hypothetical protein
VLPGKDTHKPGMQQNSWVTPLGKNLNPFVLRRSRRTP